MRSLVPLTLLLSIPTTLNAQIFPSDNGEALAEIEDFDASVEVATWLEMDGDPFQFQESASRAFVLALRRDGVRVETSAPNYLFCRLYTALSDSIVTYVWKLEFYYYNSEGLHLLLWETGGIVTVGSNNFTPATAIEECVDAFASEWLRWNPPPR